MTKESFLHTCGVSILDYPETEDAGGNVPGLEYHSFGHTWPSLKCTDTTKLFVMGLSTEALRPN